VETPRKLFVVINPVAGKGRVGKKIDRIKSELSSAGLTVSRHYTEYPGHANLLVTNHTFGKGEICVCAGGDGTFNEIASALAGTGIPIAVLPFGSGNGLARSLGIKSGIRSLIKYLSGNKIQRIDGGHFSDKFFFCTCGIGFDAVVADKFNERSKRGLIGYVSHVIRSFFSYKGISANVLIDGKNFSGKFFLITIANAPQYGNNAMIAPGANVSDGIFDVVLIKPFPGIFAPLVAIALFSGFIAAIPQVSIFKARDIQILSADSHLMHADGESILVEWPIAIHVYPGCVHVIN